MSDKLINNPLDEIEEKRPPKKPKKVIDFSKFKKSFLGKDEVPSPCLLIIAILLLLLFKIAMNVFPDKASGYLGVLILLTIIFFIPAYLFYKFTKRGRVEKVFSELKITAPKINHIFLLFFGGVFISIIVFLVNLLFKLRTGYVDGFYLYNTFFTGKLPVPESPLFPIIAFALAPAICEEFMFRGIFHASYEKQSFMAAALTSSVMYALISLDTRTFISNFLLGLFLSFVLFLTKSLISCFIVNLLTKCFMLFFGTNLQSYILSASNRAVFFTVVIGSLLISFAVFAYECSKIFKLTAKGKYMLPETDSNHKTESLIATKSNITSISMIICALLFIAFNVLTIFI